MQPLSNAAANISIATLHDNRKPTNGSQSDNLDLYLSLKGKDRGKMFNWVL